MFTMAVLKIGHSAKFSTATMSWSDGMISRLGSAASLHANTAAKRLDTTSMSLGIRSPLLV